MRKYLIDPNLSIRHLDSYIHVIQPPGFVFNRDVMSEVWDAMARACKEFDCYKILIEGTDFRRELDTVSAYDSGVAAAGMTPGMQIALFLEPYQPDDISEFFKTVALNRGTHVEFFDSKEKALEWLGVADQT